NEGLAELWYLPTYGFRLVIRNLPRKRVLSDIRYRCFLRNIIPAGLGSSVATYNDEILLARDDFFVFPGNDQVLICFSLEYEPESSDMGFVHTDKLGNGLATHKLEGGRLLVVDFKATLQNLFNFNIGMARRIEITASRMREIAAEMKTGQERSFSVSRIRSV